MRNVRFSSALAVAASALLTAGAAVAQPVANDSEIQLSGALFHAQGSDTGLLSFDGSYGYYLSPAFELGIRQGLQWTIIDDADDVWAATTVPTVNYHFRGLTKDDRVLPFIGGFVGAVWNDDDATGVLGPSVGAKFFMSEHAFVLARYQYEWFFSDFDRIDNNSDDGNHVVSLGLGYVWGGTGARGPTY